MFTRIESNGVAWHTDAELRNRHGIVVAFSERIGGHSVGPYAGLNLAAHVGDDAVAVDENRSMLMGALGIGASRARLTMSEQVHGTVCRLVSGSCAGMGAYAREGGVPPVPGCDALLTAEDTTPLMLCFADCVPVVIVATAPRRAVAVVHAGWKGALGRLPGRVAVAVAEQSGCAVSDVLAYIGPHIGPCHYPIDDTRMSHFVNAFGSIAAAQGGLDLAAVVSASLGEVGVPLSSVVRSGVCTAERTDAFFSFRAEGLTGRHGAVACILGNA